MSAKRAKKERKVFNIYNLLVLLSIGIILGSAYLLLERQGIDVIATIKEKLPEDWFKEKAPEVTNTPKTTTNASNTVSSGVLSGDEISEDKAVELAIEQFKELGETGLQKNEMEIMQIQKAGELYYHIASPENTVEIKIKGGKITRLNNVLVDK